MKKTYSEFISSLELTAIRVISTSEKVLFDPNPNEIVNVQMKVEKASHKDEPKITDDLLVCTQKFRFEFAIDGKTFYTAEYEIFTSFMIKDMNIVSSSLEDETIKTVFAEKQIGKLVWSCLRGTVMDGFNRHSLKPIPLPLLL